MTKNARCFFKQRAFFVHFILVLDKKLEKLFIKNCMRRRSVH